jgi:hypothetical protein
MILVKVMAAIGGRLHIVTQQEDLTRRDRAKMDRKVDGLVSTMPAGDQSTRVERDPDAAGSLQESHCRPPPDRGRLRRVDQWREISVRHVRSPPPPHGIGREQDVRPRGQSIGVVDDDDARAGGGREIANQIKIRRGQRRASPDDDKGTIRPETGYR